MYLTWVNCINWVDVLVGLIICVYRFKRSNVKMIIGTSKMWVAEMVRLIRNRIKIILLKHHSFILRVKVLEYTSGISIFYGKSRGQRHKAYVTFIVLCS